MNQTLCSLGIAPTFKRSPCLSVLRLATFRLPRYTRAALSRHPWRLGGAAAFGLMPGGGFIS